MQAHDHVLRPVSHHDEEASLLFLQAILNERWNARVTITMSVEGIQSHIVASALTPPCVASFQIPFQINCSENTLAQMRSHFRSGTQRLKNPKFWRSISFCRAVNFGQILWIGPPNLALVTERTPEVEYRGA
jgi:hypothetical protein